MLSELNSDDDNDWEEVNSKTKRTGSLTVDNLPKDLSTNNNDDEPSLKEKFVTKIGNISLWMTYIYIEDIDYLINETLKTLDKCSNGNVSSLWDCLFSEFKMKNNEYLSSNDMRKAIYELIEYDSEIYGDWDHIAMAKLSSKYEIKMTFSSIDKNLKDIVYGQSFLTSFHILHIGLDWFLSLKSAKKFEKYTLNKGMKNKISQVINGNKNNSGLFPKKDEIEKFSTIKKILTGMEKPDVYNILSKSENKMEYDIYTEEELDKMQNLVICELKITGAHSGIAIPIDMSNNYKEIKLLNRRNCGYNAFDGDTVYVKINDPKIPTGKVMGVLRSYHKPVNNLYICKVNRDQGSLMSPLDNSFPKIHVDNQPGRRKYENKLLQADRYKISKERMSVIEREKESAKYADNLYYSLYDVSVITINDRPSFKLKAVVDFIPDFCEHYFIVCYERWNPYYMYPMGKIVGTLSSYDTIESNFHFITSMCNLEQLDLTEKYNEEIKKIKKEAKCFVESSGILPSSAIVFSIDNANTVDIDDAISFHKENEDTIIGVHISDVTKYISPTHEAYKQAAHRVYSAYPPKSSKIPPIHIFEKDLSTDVFSLLPNKRRAVVSILFRFTKVMLQTFDISNVIPHTFHEGFIISQYQLNYNEVSSWLRNYDVPQNENLLLALTEIYEITKKLRQTRLPYSYFVRQVNECYKDMSFERTFEGEMLIEELMLLSNEYVAKKIFEKYPNSTLLRIQNPVQNYEKWLENLLKSTKMNVAGQLKEYCSLLKVFSFNSLFTNQLIVSKKFFNRFCTLFSNDKEKAKDLLLYDAYYNEFFVHIIEWYKMNHQARYDCSIESDMTPNSHFSLNKNLYTHFTSPIRRFPDIVVHRFLKSVINNTEIVDNSLDINEICRRANQKQKGYSKFEEICSSYSTINEVGKKFCFILDCACSEINNNEISFVHPLLQKSNSSKIIKFSNLNLDDVPKLSENFPITFCIFQWRRIIFSCPPNITNNSSDSKFTIDKDLYNVFLSNNACDALRNIRQTLTFENDMKKKLKNLKSQFTCSNYDTIISSDSFSIFNPVITIEIEVYFKSTMRIQFCKSKFNGVMQIYPELYIVSPTFQICLLHHNDPVRLFVPGGKLKWKFNDSKKTFDTIEDYRAYFTPLIYLESITETLAENVSFSLINVPIKWIVKKNGDSEIPVRYGIILLSDEFCKDRNIFFSNEKHVIIDRYEYLIDKEISSVGSDLLCLRFIKKSWSNYWIGHGEVVHVSKFRKDQDTFKIIIFSLIHSDFDAFSSIQDNETYFIDIFRKSIVTRRQQMVMNYLDNHLVKHIILGSISSSRIDNNHIITKKYFNFNKSQLKAIRKALNFEFSLIWGPPGTGKTLIGCCLSFEYVNLNREQNNVVLYCGPSNDCVDLVSVTMKEKFNEDCPKLLRIYGDHQEFTDFPLPGYIIKNHVPLSDEMKSISLHFLIRKDGDYVNDLKEYDEKFKKILMSQTISHEDNIHDSILKYKRILKKAKLAYIENNKCDIVLCTTSITAKHIIKQFNITQIIIDEAGMCKEPETIIPICTFSKTVENIVLIGDHKQLRPIILNNLAGKHGLQISLFERYQYINRKLITMLDFQYRMHPSICEFPSREFYFGKLQTQISSLWSGLTFHEFKNGKEYYYNKWNGIDYSQTNESYNNALIKSNYTAIGNEKWPRRECPYVCFKFDFSWYPERTIFIDVLGDEIIHSVSTSVGNENSRGNEYEVEVCSYIYSRLIENLASPQSITVLTQYRLQQHLLERKCQEILRSKGINCEPIVKTVIRSQGSENDYVIFSTVRSLKNEGDINKHPTPGWAKQYLGFITDPNQINVALTRAKKGLIIIGNKQLLKVNCIWKNLISNYESRNCVIDDFRSFI